MFRACSAQEMRDADRAASEIGKIPSIVLMENAALRCVEELLARFGELKNLKIGVFCGKGNNGGDGFAIARHLDRLGADVDVFTICGEDFTPDAEINFDMLKNTACSVMENTEFPEYEIPLYDIVVDAIFGTGIKGAVKGSAADAIDAINRYAGFVMAVDVPSGMNSDTGEISGACIRADLTVTLAAYKKGLFLYPGASYCGEVVCADICIPDIFLDKSRTYIIDNDFVKAVFPKRRDNSQKGDYGKVLIVAGSTGMTGAAVMAAQAALVSGSGLVTIACCEEVNTVLEQKTTEVMTISLKSRNGRLSKECAEELIKILPNYDAVLFGPGLGRSEDIGVLLREVLRHCEVPLIIDADGLFALSAELEGISECNCEILLTPHEMEMSRLCGCEVSQVAENRLDISRTFAEENGVTLILKGHHSIVTSPDGTQYINTKGNSGMATGGSGDILAGICVSLAARGMKQEEAAAAAVYIHGAAGDEACLKYGKDGVTALRIYEFISETVRKILR